MADSSSPPVTRLIRNALFNTGGFGVNVVITFLTTPFFVLQLGPEVYGVFILITGLTGYYSLMELGLGQGVTKFVAAHLARKDYKALNNAVNAAIWIQVAVGPFASLSLIVFGGPLLRLLQVPANYFDAALSGLYIVAIAFFLQMLAGTLSAVVKGLQRYDLSSKVAVALQLAKNGLMVVVLLVGGGLYELLLVTALIGAATFVAYAFILKRELPSWRLAPSTWPATRELFNFSGFILLGRLSSFFGTYVVRVVLSSFLGPAAVTYFVVPMQLLTALRGLLNSAFSTLFPYASELGAQEDKQRLNKLWRDATRLLLCFAAPMYLLTAVFARPLLGLWISPEFAAQSWIYLSLLSLFTFFSSFTVVTIHMSLGLGYARLRSYYSVVETLLYAALLVPLTARYGTIGAVVATMISSLPGFFFIAYVARHIMRASFTQFLRYTGAAHVPLLLLTIAALTTGMSQKLPVSVLSLIILVGLGAGYLVLLLVTGWVPASLLGPVKNRLLRLARRFSGARV